MPEKEYSFLSDRERRYLENPDNFDSQTKAEISYRIRKKLDGYLEDLQLLEKTYREWALRTPEDSDILLFCNVCEETVWIGKESYSHLAQIASLPNDSVYPEGWEIIGVVRPFEIEQKSHESGIMGYREGFCPDCYDELEVIEEAKQSGKLPCSKSDCGKHRIDSNPFEEHREYIPISKDRMKEIRNVL